MKSCIPSSSDRVANTASLRATIGLFAYLVISLSLGCSREDRAKLAAKTSNLVAVVNPDPVSLIQNSALDFDRSVTIGNALDNYGYFKTKSWSVERDAQKRTSVVFEGKYDLDKFAGTVFPMRIDGDAIELDITTNIIFTAKRAVPGLEYALIARFDIAIDGTDFQLAPCDLKVSGKVNNEKLAMDQADTGQEEIKAIWRNQPSRFVSADLMEKGSLSKRQLLEAELNNDPANADLAVNLAQEYIDTQEAQSATRLLDALLAREDLQASTLVRSAQLFGRLEDWTRLERALRKLVQVRPDSPEAWYDLAALEANLSKDDQAKAPLIQALKLSDRRLKQSPKAHDLRVDVRTDQRFSRMRENQQYLTLFSSDH